MSDRILICYDGSAEARHAIVAAGEVVAEKRAVVLNVGPPLDRAESLALLAPATLDWEHVNAQSAREVAEQGTVLARRAGFDAEPKGGVAAPVWQAIVDYAEEIDAAMIVLGSRGLSELGELVRNSVSHKVAEHAGRAVLVVPHPHERAAG
jgi:nucleotide-binding universal stress UspA family protein